MEDNFCSPYFYRYYKDYQGIIMLASISLFKDLFKLDLKALSLIGSEDGIVTLDIYIFIIDIKIKIDFQKI